MINRISRLAMLSALAMSSGLFGVATASEPEVEPEPPPPPPLTPEQIKAQEKRARRAEKRSRKAEKRAQ